MMRGPLPDELTRFILTSIASIPHLEAILLMRNEDSSAWDGKRVAQRLYIGEKTADDLLSSLHAAGFLAIAASKTEQYCYQPVSGELRAMVDQLAKAYSKNLMDVTHLVHSKTSTRAQQFADAFKWRKEP